MQCNGALRRPLRDIIKSIGHVDKHSRCANRRQHSTLLDYHQITSRDAKAGSDAVRPVPLGHGRSTRWSCDSERYTPGCGSTRRGYITATREQPSLEPVAGEDESSESTTTQDSTPPGGPAITLTPTDVAEDGAREPRMKDTVDFGPSYFQSQIHRQSAEQSKAAKRHNVLQRQRDSDTWKRILRMLDGATPANIGRYKRIVEIVTLPKGVAAVFEPSKEIAVLEIMQRTGCHLQMVSGYAVQGRSNAFTGIALQGTHSQNSSALSLLPQYITVSNLETAETRARLKRKELRRTLKTEESEDGKELDYWQIYEDDGNTQRPNDRQVEGDQEASNPTLQVRSVWAVDRLKNGVEQQIQKSKRDVPSLRTPADFTAYVHDLTVMRRGVRSSIDDPQPSVNPSRRRIDSEMQDLVSLFTDSTTSHLSTPESIARSIDFLAKHSNFAAIRQIFKALDEDNRSIGPLGFNALLSAAAHAGDIHNFEQVLMLMRRRRTTWTPGSSTWASLHNLLCQRMPDEADAIPLMMRDKGHLRNNHSLKMVIQNEVRHHLISHIQSGGDIDGFLTAYSTRIQHTYQRPGHNWLDTDVLNRMLYVLVTLGRTKEAVRLLEHFRENGHTPVETATLNTLLSTTSHDFDGGSAIAVLRHFRVGDAGAVMPDMITYQILFMIAWRRKYYNMLRVVWRYACVAGEVTYDMRRRMTRSLLAYSPLREERLGMSSVFRAWAAKFAVDVARDLIPGTLRPYETSPDRLLGADELRLLVLGCQDPLEKKSAESTARRQELKGYIENDLKEAGSCKPVLPLPIVLERAWQKDLRWQERGAAIPQGHHSDAGRDALQHALLHGIRVPMRPGDFSKFRKWEVPALLRQRIVLDADEPRIQELKTIDELQKGEVE